MPKGRQQKWICRSCKQEFSVQGTAPKFCCSCGSTDLGRAPSYELIVNYDEKEKELRELCEKMNPVYERFASMKSQYDEIMSYWQKQKARGYITKEQYEEYGKMFIGYGKKCP